MQTQPAPHARNFVHPELIPLIQFFSIEIAPLSNGRFFVAVSATLCEHDGELSTIEVAAQQVDRFDEALRVVAETAAPATRVVQ